MVQLTVEAIKQVSHKDKCDSKTISMNAVFTLLAVLSCSQRIQAFVAPYPTEFRSSYLQYGPPEDDVLGSKNFTYYRNNTAPNDFNSKVDIHYSRSTKFPERKKENSSTNASPRGIHYSRSTNFPDRQKGKISANDNAERLSTFSFSSNAASKKQDTKKKKTVREFLSSSLSSIKGKIGKTRSVEKEDEKEDPESIVKENDPDPLCDIDDEDCHAFSTLDSEYAPNDAQNFDFQDWLLPTDDIHSDAFLAANLRSRSESIMNKRVYENWMSAHCPTTFVSVGQDWVRRVDMDAYPIAVCGSARGGVYVVNLEDKNIIAKVEKAHSVQVHQGGANRSRVNTNTEVAKQGKWLA